MADLNENPRVNRHLADIAMDHIDHALGRPTFPLKESFRNYFCIDADSALARGFEASPYWTMRNAVPGGMVYYSVTAEGRTALAAHLKRSGDLWKPWAVTWSGHTRVIAASSRAQARYRHFLDIADCCADLTFGTYLRAVRIHRLPETTRHG